MTMELLAPAGGPEPFRAALAAGADAIYCGVGNDFNARRGAHNFTYDAFEQACRAAHLAGTRVYVTINVVVRDDEMDRALALVRSAAIRGADAFIVQDWGLFEAIRRTWPELELHVSTQANVHDARGVRWCRERGAHRVTLSRELSLPEIARIAKEGVELEVFGHGALCYCYSGVCLMSSMAGGRSANRGLCAQPCRLLYRLVDEHGRDVAAPGRTRPLCPKDACTAADVAALMGAGVGSLKVEGRMKAPDYVWSVVGAYREQIDSVLAAGGAAVPELGATPVSPAVAHRLKRAFNRDFTDAYLRGSADDEMMSYERSNNRGELAGEVLSSSGGQVQRRDGRGNLHKDPRQDKHSARCTVTIRVSEPVGAGDLLELRPVDDPDAFLTTTAQVDAAPGDVIECRVARPMPKGCPVRVIRSAAAHAGSDAALALEVPRKRHVGVRVVARLGEPFRVELACVDGPALPGGSLPHATAEGFVVEAARTRPVTEDDLAEHVGRMGSTPFEPVSFEVELDEGCGMGFSAVHKVRAAACEQLERAILEPYTTRARALAAAPKGASAAIAAATLADAFAAPAASAAPADVPAACAAPATPEVCVLAPTPEVAAAAAAAGATRVYAQVDDLDTLDGWPAGTIAILDEVCREPDHARLDARVAAGVPVAVGNVSELALAAERGAVPELRGCIPVHNEACLAALEAAGAAGVWLSPELTLEEIAHLASCANVPVGLVVSGRPRVMTAEHCVLKVADACIHDCARCGLRARRLSLRDRDGRLLPVRTDLHARSRIYDAVPLDLTPQVGDLVAAGVTRLAVDATLLDEAEATAAVERLVRALAAVASGRKPAARERHASSGHLFWGIG